MRAWGVTRSSSTAARRRCTRQRRHRARVHVHVVPVVVVLRGGRLRGERAHLRRYFVECAHGVDPPVTRQQRPHRCRAHRRRFASRSTEPVTCLRTTAALGRPRPHRRRSGFGGVSCPSASFCIAVDDGGDAFTYDGSSWSAPDGIFSSGGLMSVSCPSVSFCVAVGDFGEGGAALTYNGSSWSAPTVIDGTPFGSVRVRRRRSA